MLVFKIQVHKLVLKNLLRDLKNNSPGFRYTTRINSIKFSNLEMILGIKIYKDEKNPLNATVFPLAFPLIAGPGSLTTLLSLKAAYSNTNIIIAIFINMLFIYIVLKGSSKIEKIIGENGIGIIRKIFGVVLLAISIKLFTSNIKFLL